jgi:hypothetical protein
MAVGREGLLELGRAGFVFFRVGAFVGVVAAFFEGVAPIAAVGEDLAAGEKLIFVCRLRSRAFLAMVS